MHTKEFNQSTVKLPVSHENICLDCLYISFAFKLDPIYFPEESKIKVTLLKNNCSSILHISIPRLRISSTNFFKRCFLNENGWSKIIYATNTTTSKTIFSIEENAKIRFQFDRTFAYLLELSLWPINHLFTAIE